MARTYPQLDLHDGDGNGGSPHRFILGHQGETPRIAVLGLNPNTAHSEEYDNTMRRVAGILGASRYGGFAMFNLYPLRAKKPEHLADNPCTTLHQLNLESTERLLKEHPFGGVWAAWGEKIELRQWLYSCLRDLYSIPLLRELPWEHYGDLTASGHPRHPCRVANGLKFHKFDVSAYLTSKRRPSSR